MTSFFPASLIAPQNPVVRYILQVFHRDPFRGLYHPNAFDLAILIPYFTILIILSVYGVHRYYLTYLYLKNRRKLPKPRETFERLPRVTIQLPMYNERYVVERLLEAATHIDYPRELLEVEAILLDGHFVIEHGARNFSGRFFNFNGTAGMWRRAAIEDAGGWQHDTLTEDTDLSYRAQLRGWKFIYDPRVECPSELPVEMNAFKAQQARWAKGLIQTGGKLLPAIWRSPQLRSIKLEATFHLTANIAYPLMVLFAVILLPAIIVRFYQGWFQMLYLDLPLFLASTCSVSMFYLVAQRELYPRGWHSRLKYMPLVMATGIGLSLKNSKVVVEALLGRKSEFVRTPKYRVEGRADRWERKKYLNRAGWLPAAELGLAVYFLFNIAYSFTIENYLTTPFLMLFFMCYSYTGAMSLLQTPLRRL